MVTADRGSTAARSTVEVALTIAGCPLRAQIQRDVDTHVGALPGVGSGDGDHRGHGRRAEAGGHGQGPAASPGTTRRRPTSPTPPGWSPSPRARAASARARSPSTWPWPWPAGASPSGCSTPTSGDSRVPRLLGMQGDVEARDKKMVPLERARRATGILRVLSMGFLADEEHAIMWRGLILNRAVQQFLEDVHWGDLDFLLIDMPPGTGDIQMGLARMMPRTEVLVVTTPPLAAQKVAARTADMARKGYLRVTGVIENMSDFTCEHGDVLRPVRLGRRRPPGRRDRGPAARPGPAAPVGGRRRRRRHPGGPRRRPTAGRGVRPDRRRAGRPTRPPVVSMDGCSARMLERVEAAVCRRRRG